ncbi:MAG: hypothetical protein M3N54_15895 [Acidobacteriota bacterium]|nr:hypothetical protein [Acidobacteriota bacterium]
MKPVECEFEPEVLAAVIQSRWPQRVDAQLRTHVAECRICADVAAVAGAIEESREEIRSAAVIPDSGRVWWLAQMRARREAARTAGRPITVAQVLAFASAVGLMGACFGATSAWFQAALPELGRAMGPALMAAVSEHGFLIAGAAGLVLLIPAAVYFIVVRD